MKALRRFGDLFYSKPKEVTREELWSVLYDINKLKFDEKLKSLDKIIGITVDGQEIRRIGTPNYSRIPYNVGEEGVYLHYIINDIQCVYSHDYTFPDDKFIEETDRTGIASISKRWQEKLREQELDWNWQQCL